MTNLKGLIGTQIKAIRKAKGLSQQDVADRVAENTGQMSFSKSRISEIETGKQNTTLETLEMIIKALGVKPVEFFDFKKIIEEDRENEIMDKSLLLDCHYSMLKERELDEVKYVVKTTKELFKTMDGKKKKN
ncbi:helix-turn-helix transcriptional regulator [Caldifermentibacillus hisashii]|jgi:transcriptional regulator with XRE-family HTH domain|uniref:HTH cro/C1-type domain-containing protein n=3 Tax=Bacillaceae TaxID=186817 RepID=A0A090IT90_9BACI|nr:MULTISPECIES: helix-turn-helix transcriptional regulator [Bacillaceae]AWI11697.1 XRE family transcriptional regulator [Caldibacillus thermoamylovorans]MCB7068657.1 helix-turn-helix domain-containing protein [Caldibacillus sp. 210928-DFI.2.22]MCB7072185.1 helix-turn-helix domain-containing protein [Caldibacillus sp. 210928-DFI.2.18]MCM3053929.1 helix-turn-helix domain-containing protein [Caldibacillus thermoamylovorans]MCM3475897.1 helix-turn-helix domain-containing protein [Caldibacillus th